MTTRIKISGLEKIECKPPFEPQPASDVEIIKNYNNPGIITLVWNGHSFGISENHLIAILKFLLAKSPYLDTDEHIEKENCEENIFNYDADEEKYYPV